MMQDMIVNLMEQANEEASAKLWCDTELGTNKQTRDTKSAVAKSSPLSSLSRLLPHV